MNKRLWDCDQDFLMLYMTKRLSNKLHLKKQHMAMHERRDNSIGASKLLAPTRSLASFYLLISRSTRRTRCWYFSVLFQNYMIISSPSCSTVRKLSSWRRSRQLSYLMRLEKGQIKRSRQDRVWWSREGKEEENEEKVQAYQRRVTFVIGKALKEWLQASVRVAEEEGVNCGGRRSKWCRWH